MSEPFTNVKGEKRKQTNRLAILLVLAICFLAPQVLASKPDSSNSTQTRRSLAYAPGELLVKYKASVRAAATQYYRTQWDIRTFRTFRAIGVQHLKLPKEMTVEEAVEIYLEDSDVEYAEPNYYRYATATPNDTYFDRLWGLHNTGQKVNATGGTADADIDAPEAWDITTGGSDIVIAVIDSGVDYNHPDFSGNIWYNIDEIPDNGIDDDGNGYVDDVLGWDFVGSDKDPMDSNDHGTHVAGTIAAKGNNATGITGVCWTAKIMPLRFLDDSGSGTVADEISAIDYAIGNGAKIINASFGSYGYSLAEKDVISNANSAGILFVAAAGNEGNDNDMGPSYPASHDLANIVAVAATDQDDNLCWFSNYGATSVDVGAPGVNIYSTSPGAGYQYMDGTSMATPHVAGLAGLIWGFSSSLTHTEVKGIILNSVDSKASLSGKTTTGGRINAFNAFPQAPPQAPGGFGATPASTSKINLSWTDNSSNEWGFKIERRPGSGGTYSQVDSVTANVTSYSDAGLSEATTYYYRVCAYNSAGNSGYSDEASATTYLAAPSGLSAAGASISQIDLSWTDNSSNEWGFKIERKTGSGGTYAQISTVVADVTFHSDTGLTASTTYYYRVRAYTSGSNSTYSNDAIGITKTSAKSGGGDGRCFIATAAFGSYMEPHVRVLREFRDRFLLTNPAGKAFVSLYCAYSPPIAEFIARHDSLRAMVRLSLLPLVGVSYMASHFGLAITATVLFGVFVLTIILLSYCRKRVRCPPFLVRMSRYCI